MNRFVTFKLWSKRKDLRVILVGAVLSTLIAGGYFWAWPAIQWHFHTKPALLKSLQDVRNPQVEVRKLASMPAYPFAIEYDHVRASSPIAISITKRGIEADTFQIFITKNFPNEPTKSYINPYIGALSIQAENIKSADSMRERALAQQAVEGRLMLFGDYEIDGQLTSNKFDRSVIVESPKATILFWSSPELISGIIVDRSEGDRRDFIMKLDGIDRDSAEKIVESLAFE